MSRQTVRLHHKYRLLMYTTSIVIIFILSGCLSIPVFIYHYSSFGEFSESYLRYPSDFDLIINFVQLMNRQDEACKLPCWWGLEPGKTTLAELTSFIQATGFDQSWQAIYPFLTLDEYILGGEIFGIDYIQDISHEYYMSFHVKDNVLRWINLNFYDFGLVAREWYLQDFDLPSILALLSATPEIRIRRHSVSTVYIYLLDRVSNIWIEYTFDFSKDNSGSVLSRLCPSFENTGALRIILGRSVDDREINVNDVPTAEETIGIDSETFVKFFLENPDGCLQVQK